MIRESKHERRLKAIRRAEFSLKQRLERIEWEEKELMPEVNDFLARAQMPDPPDGKIVDVEYTDNPKAK